MIQPFCKVLRFFLFILKLIKFLSSNYNNMYFSRVNVNGKTETQRLEPIDAAKTLRHYYNEIKPSQHGKIEKKLEIFVGTDVNFESTNLFCVQEEFTINTLKDAFPNFNRILFNATVDSEITEPNLICARNLNVILMQNASELRYPEMDAKTYPGERKLWNLIVTSLRAAQAGFRAHESADMKQFMDCIYNTLW